MYIYTYILTLSFIYIFTLCVKTAVLFYSSFISGVTETIMSQILTIQHQEYSHNHGLQMLFHMLETVGLEVPGYQHC